MSNHPTSIIRAALPTKRKITTRVIFKPIWAAIVGLATLQLATTIKPAHAFNVTYDFTVQINSDAYESQGLTEGMLEQGRLTYDNSVLTGTGSEYVSASQGNLTLTFNFLNNIYTEKDDLDYGSTAYVYDYPVAFFTDGQLVGLDFLVVSSQLQPPQNAPGFRIYNNTFYVGATDNFNSGIPVGTVTYTAAAAVPEPSEVGGAIVASSLLGFWALKKAKGQKGEGSEVEINS